MPNTFKEKQHPRDLLGKFASALGLGGGGDSGSSGGDTMQISKFGRGQAGGQREVKLKRTSNGDTETIKGTVHPSGADAEFTPMDGGDTVGAFTIKHNKKTGEVQDLRISGASEQQLQDGRDALSKIKGDDKRIEAAAKMAEDVRGKGSDANLSDHIGGRGPKQEKTIKTPDGTTHKVSVEDMGGILDKKERINVSPTGTAGRFEVETKAGRVTRASKEGGGNEPDLVASINKAFDKSPANTKSDAGARHQLVVQGIRQHQARKKRSAKMNTRLRGN